MVQQCEGKPGTGNLASVVDQAVDDMAGLEEVQSVKEEALQLDSLEHSAGDLSLFPAEVVQTGAIEIDSSSGSESSSDSDSSTDAEPLASEPREQVRFSETVPAGFKYFRHKKSSIVHSLKDGDQLFKCKSKPGANFTEMPKIMHIKLPKCLKCFPQNPDRIRSLSQMTQALDSAVKRSRFKVSH